MSYDNWQDDFEEFGWNSSTSVTTTDTNTIPNEGEKKKQLVLALDVDPEVWKARMIDLYETNVLLATEVINDFCGLFLESYVSTIRVALEIIVRCDTFDFLLRSKCAETLGNDFYILEVLEAYYENTKEDVNFTMYAEYLQKFICNPLISDDVLERLLTFIFTTKIVGWNSKFKLFKTLSDTRATSLKLINNVAKSLITNNPLSNYTVLVMQLFAFDDKIIASLLKRTKLHRDAVVKADILDHLLDYAKFKAEALDMLKQLGQGLRTLDSSQNVHMVTADVDTWLEHLKQYQPLLHAADLVKEKIEEQKDTEEQSAKQREQVFYAIQRIEYDNSVWGRGYYKMNNIFQRLVQKILVHPNQEELFKRLKEELCEMSQTCSRGHLYRLMNVFSGFDENEFIRVDPAVELRSVINKRIEMYLATLQGKYEVIETQNQFEGATEAQRLFEEHRVRDDKKEEEQKKQREAQQADERDIYEKVMDAWMDRDDAVLQKHFYGPLSFIHDEIQADYVGQGIMTQTDFTTIYRDVVNKLFIS